MTWTTWRGPGHPLEFQPTAETPEQAAHRFYGRLIREGYRLAYLWCYSELDPTDLYWLLRFECEGKKKQPRALMRDKDGVFYPRKPEFTNGVPLLNLQRLVWNPGETVWVLEGEKCADAGEAWGLLATTWAGGANSILRTNWTPLAGRKVVLWPDNEDTGVESIKALFPILKAQGTSFVRVDVAALEIRRHGDIVDWLDQMWKADPTESTWELRVWGALDALPLVVEE